MSPTSAMLATTFGHGYRRPLLVARLKLAGFCIGALFLGVLLSNNVPQLTSINGYSQTTWIATAILAVQLVVVISLSLASNLVARSRTSLLLTMLPLRKRQIEFLLLFPGLVLTLCSLALVTPILANICLRGGLNLTFFTLSILIGYSSALGLAFSLADQWLCKGLTVIVLAGEYKLLEFVREDNATWAILLILITLGALCILATRAGNMLTQLSRRSTITKHISRHGLPAWGWFFKKFWRYPSLQQSFLVTLILAFVLATIVLRYGAFGSSLTVMAAQVLAASMSSDIRALARTFRPVEIYALRGTSYFSRHLVLVGTTVSYLALLPIEIATALSGLPVVPLLAFVLSGVGIGLFVGSWLTPRPGDVGAQLVANLACIGIAVVTSRSTPDQYTAILLHCGLAALGIGLSFFVEYKRNALTWRKHDI